MSTGKPDLALHLLLGLVGVNVPRETIETWTPEMHEAALAWATATHMSASDNDVMIPDIPDFLREVSSGSPRWRHQFVRSDTVSDDCRCGDHRRHPVHDTPYQASQDYIVTGSRGFAHVLEPSLDNDGYHGRYRVVRVHDNRIGRVYRDDITTPWEAYAVAAAVSEPRVATAVDWRETETDAPRPRWIREVVFVDSRRVWSRREDRS